MTKKLINYPCAKGYLTGNNYYKMIIHLIKCRNVI